MNEHNIDPTLIEDGDRIAWKVTDLEPHGWDNVYLIEDEVRCVTPAKAFEDGVCRIYAKKYSYPINQANITEHWRKVQ